MFDRMWLRKIASVIMLALVSMPAASAAQEASNFEKPNFLFILADDLDAGPTSRMPKLQEQIVAEGLGFDQAFVTTPQCCPSRASILTGKYAHNHTVYDNHKTLGGAQKFHASGEDESTIATWLNDKGYDTIMIGKYLNFYDGTYVPPGWDEWHGQMGGNNNHRYNVNGNIKYFDPAVYHDTDLFSDWATEYIRQGAGKTQPFFMYLSVNAPHGPAIPAERHKDEFSEEELPRPPSFNEADVSDKPERMSSQPLLTDEQVANMTSTYRNRLRSMLSVDDMIERLIYELGQTGELENTYIVFTSDNGFHMGQHRMAPGKTRAYEEDIHVPLFMRGPGVPAGRTLEHKVLNIDFAPTFAKLGGAQAPPRTDGRSFVSLLSDSPPPSDSWRDSSLIKFQRQGVSLPLDSYSALRTGEYTYIEHDTGERELYDLRADPYQLESLHASAEHQELIDALHGRLAVLKSCSGAGCRAADGGTLLATPTGLGAIPSPSGVALEWDDSFEEAPAGYNVYRADSEWGPFTMLNAELLSTSSYDDAEAPAGQLSHYWVTAVDTAGNESAPAAVSATRPDTTPPETAIDPSPRRPINDATPTFSFSATDDVSSAEELLYSYRVDEGQWWAYSGESTLTLGGETGLADGLHTFQVKAKDTAGNEDQSPAQRTFTVDTKKPVVESVLPAEDATDIDPVANVEVFFSEAMRAGSVTAKTVKLFERGSSVPIAAQLTYEAATKKVILNPDTELAAGKTYRTIVTTGVRDLAGNQLDQDPSVTDNQRKMWFFTVRR